MSCETDSYDKCILQEEQWILIASDHRMKLSRKWNVRLDSLKCHRSKLLTSVVSATVSLVLRGGGNFM